MSQDIINIIHPFLYYKQMVTYNPLAISIYIQEDLRYMEIINIYKTSEHYVIVFQDKKILLEHFSDMLITINIALLQYTQSNHKITFNITLSDSNEVIFQNINRFYTISQKYTINKYDNILRLLTTIITGSRDFY